MMKRNFKIAQRTGSCSWVINIDPDSSYAEIIGGGIVHIEKETPQLTVGDTVYELSYPHTTERFAAASLSAVEKHVRDVLVDTAKVTL